MTTKTIVLVTGANSGIGYETVKALAQSPRAYHILLGSRSLDRGAAAMNSIQSEVADSLSSIELLEIDVSSDDSIQQAHNEIEERFGRLDVLVNNAGHSVENQALKGDISMREAWNSMFDVNVTGSHLTTHAFAPLLLKSSEPRLIFVSSGLAQLNTMGKTYYPGTPPSKGWPKTNVLSPDGYRASKTALSMVMLNWHWLLHNDGVKVLAVSPGWLATNLGGRKEKLKQLGAGDPAIGGALLAGIIAGERDGDVGKVVAGNQSVQPF